VVSWTFTELSNCLDAVSLNSLITERRSIRRFRRDPVSIEMVEQLLQLAVQAPSSMNGQPWEFVIVRDSDKLRALGRIKNHYCPNSKKNYPASMFDTAPLAVVICVNEELANERGVESAIFATAYLQLTAHEQGLGSVYLSADYKKAPGLSEDICRLLSIPKHVKPISILPLGYPDETPSKKELAPVKIFLDSYNENPWP